MDPAEEADLVARLKAGDPEAFDRAHAAWSDRLYGFLLRMSQRRDLAEDLLQETWLRLARRAAGLRDDTRLGAWLFTVARNLFISHRRWRLLDGERMQELSLARYRRADADSPFELAAAGELERRLEAAVAELPPRYREVVLLVAVERMEPREAAAVLGLRPDALRQRLSRARAMIEERLAAPAAGEGKASA